MCFIYLYFCGLFYGLRSEMQRMPSRLWRSTSQRWAKCTASTARPYRGSKLETSCLEILWRFLVSLGLLLLFPILSHDFSYSPFSLSLSLSLSFSSFDKTPSVLSLFLCVMRRTRICRDDVEQYAYSTAAPSLSPVDIWRFLQTIYPCGLT